MCVGVEETAHTLHAGIEFCWGSVILLDPKSALYEITSNRQKDDQKNWIVAKQGGKKFSDSSFYMCPFICSQDAPRGPPISFSFSLSVFAKKQKTRRVCLV